MNDNIGMQLAGRSVDRYAAQVDQIMALHVEAMERFECDETLKRGIAQFKPVARMIEMIDEAAEEDIVVPEGFWREVAAICKRWMAPCDRVEQWISKLIKAGCPLDNLEQFRSTCSIAKDFMERSSWRKTMSRSRRMIKSEPW